MSLRVLICDERPLVSGGLRGVLLLAPDMDVVGSVVSISEAQSLIRATAPHVVVTGLRPGGTIGAAFVRELVREYAGDPAVVAYTTGVSPDNKVDEILRAGADGVLASGASKEELLMAIRAVARGKAMLGPAVARRLVNWYRAQPSPGPVQPVDDHAALLTPREREVLQLASDGLSAAQIAERLVIGVATVRTHTYRLRCKLQVRDRAELVGHAFRSGLARPRTPREYLRC